MIEQISSMPSSVNFSNSPREVSSGSQLQMDDFLQLLTSQITNQDPLEPMKDTEFISQMANIASLEQMEQFSKGFSKFADSQVDLLAQSYLGNQVEIFSEGNTFSGIVEAVNRNDDGSSSVVVDGKSYDPSLIKRVELSTRQ
jgi:flagellar basal-body rod modification protein FlgD